MIEVRNIFSDIPEALPDELIENILSAKKAIVKRIISRGQASPSNFWHDQAGNEWVLLLKGSAEILFKDFENPVILRPGDYIYISAHLKHRVEWTDPAEDTIWLTVHYLDISYAGDDR
jgi:cupin 2 domain-containing protein